jgi:hypothetical protein
LSRRWLLSLALFGRRCRSWLRVSLEIFVSFEELRDDIMFGINWPPFECIDDWLLAVKLVKHVP